MALSVFIIGVTGYIGGAVAVALKFKYPSHEYRAFVRSEQNVPAIRAAGFIPVLGTGDATKDRDIIAKHSKEADVVINTADADDLELTQAILGALKANSKKLPILIHTSGTGVVSDKPTGAFQETAKKVWDDSKVEDIKAIHKDQPHRVVDLAIFEAAQDNDFISYIIAPSTIYGVASANPVHKTSQQVPGLIEIALKKRQAVYGGPGTNIWNNVHIYDLAELYALLFERAISERAAGHPTNLDPFARFYWASAHGHVWGDVARALAPILYELKLVDSHEAASVDPETVSPAVATNSVTVSNRGFADGWQPSHPTLEETLREDVEGVLRKRGLKV